MNRSSSGETERWVLRRHARPDARLRLFCLPHAGGDTWMFGDWQLALPPSVEVCPVRLPGRGSRMSEPPLTDLEVLVATLADGLAALLDRPFAIFGHSMGALIGFALAQRLRRERGLDPILFCAAACRAPHLARLQPSISHLPPDLLVQDMRRRFGGRIDLAANPDLMQFVLPTLRADLALCEAFEAGSEPLACPVVAYGGSEDQSVGVAMLGGWEAHTTGPFRCHIMNGDHFFPINQKAELLQVLTLDLAWSMI